MVLKSTLSLWSSGYSVRACLYFSPSVVFSTLSFCPVCWLHVFFGVWTWSWELCRVCGAAQLTCFWFICLELFHTCYVCRLFCLSPPPPPPKHTLCFIVSSEMFLSLHVVTQSPPLFQSLSLHMFIFLAHCMKVCRKKKREKNLRRGLILRWGDRNSTYFLGISLYFSLHLHSSALWCENRKELCLNSTTLVPCGSDPISAISQSLLWLTGQRKLYFSPLAKCKPSANKSPYIFLGSLDIAFAICTYLITKFVWACQLIVIFIYIMTIHNQSYLMTLSQQTWSSYSQQQLYHDLAVGLKASSIGPWRQRYIQKVS